MYVSLRNHDPAVPSESLTHEGIRPSFPQACAERVPTRMDHAILRELHCFTQGAKLFTWPVSRQLFSVLRFAYLLFPFATSRSTH